MTDYWDLIQSRFTSNNPIEWAYDFYKKAYDDSHGGLRYGLSQIPFFGQLKRFEDSWQQWEDTYNNTGKDPVYSTRYGGNDLNSAVNVGGSSNPISRMARSLSDVYSPDVIENLSPRPRIMYGGY